MTRKYTRIVVIYGVPLAVDSSVYGAFGELLCMLTFNKHVATNNKNKQVLVLRNVYVGLAQARPKNGGDMGGTLYRQPMERLSFRYE